MKEFVVNIPEGYEIDKENSTFKKIVVKKIKEEPKRWRDDKKQILQGYYIDNDCIIKTAYTYNTPPNYNVFATEKQAKSAVAMARITQIMENDKRFGGVVTDEEWEDNMIVKCTIRRLGKKVFPSWNTCYHFLAFHTEEQRDLFLEENEDLIKDYLMID